MMGIKERVFSPLPRGVSLEDLVPGDNFYRGLDGVLDLSFVRELVRPLYAKAARLSVDPVVSFKLQLVMFFEGIRSERGLMRPAADRLSVRWYLGYDLHESLPFRFSLTRPESVSVLRSSAVSSKRSWSGALQQGWCEVKRFSSTRKIEADMAVDALAPRWAVEAYLGGLFEEETPEDGDDATERLTRSCAKTQTAIIR